MLYFAYGSNMEWSQMRDRCPSAQFVCVASLKHHRLAFTRRSSSRGCGVADVIPEQDHHVWGAVYEIGEGDIDRLDRAEGFTPGRHRNAYIRQERKVYEDGDPQKPLHVAIYFAEKQENPPLPNSDYKRLIVSGAQYWHLPQEYIDELEQIEVAP